ncbi:MAG TPA: COX15/CtaA family protein [Candidatus Acidoferrales bacterium]|nr:COX15/CtaA family protein [Candidatus Acidoferrales bacterium]
MPEYALLRINRPLHWFALLTALCTFLLLGAGGLVTSHEAGMSVPDWPNSYGYNMFLFPPSRWVGGIFYEHTHRLIASGVGLMTTILAVWLWLKDSRKWMHWVGTAAFLLVVAQGVLGGLRVVLADAQLGIFHAILGQLFFVLTSAIALFTSRFWKRLENIEHLTSNIQHPMTGYRPNVEKMDVGCSMLDVRCLFLRRLVLSTTILIFCQLIIGATMRQQHAGLAIPDFPLAYGKIWPDTGATAVQGYNEVRMNVIAENPITAFQIILQMTHRLVALAISILTATCAWQAWRRLGKKDPLTKLALSWLGLILAQALLGAATIWSNKAADVATAHVLGGALSLVTGALWCVIAFRRSAALPEFAPVTTISGAYGGAPALAANK